MQLREFTKCISLTDNLFYHKDYLIIFINDEVKIIKIKDKNYKTYLEEIKDEYDIYSNKTKNVLNQINIENGYKIYKYIIIRDYKQNSYCFLYDKIKIICKRCLDFFNNYNINCHICYIYICYDCNSRFKRPPARRVGDKSIFSDFFSNSN